MLRLEDFINHLRNLPKYRDRLVHVEHLPSQESSYGDFKKPLSRPLKELLKSKGIKKLYTHQVEAIDAIREGENVAVVTPAASGKSLVYNLPVMEEIVKDPQTRALYLYPLKALAQDQLKVIEEYSHFLSSKIKAKIYDGDTPPYQRTKIKRDPPHILLSNPDMLHLGILPYHYDWVKFLKDLRYVVIDEIHVYRGIFGSHVGNVLRRLRRICEEYALPPRFICSSATIANPKEFVERLVGVPFKVVDKSGAPRSPKYFLLWNPMDSPYTEATDLLITSIKRGLKTIVFTKARKITELIYMWTRESHPELKVSSYRAGYLPEERREIEKRLFNEELAGVISTSALELGIDVGGLDACILVGYPGTIMSTWQRGGRVGRKGREGLIIMIALDDALDQYFLNHPRDFFGRSYEAAILDVFNPSIFKSHLICAASEKPVTVKDVSFFGEKMIPSLQSLEEEGKVLKSISEEAWISRVRRPEREINIRSLGESYPIVDLLTGEVIGEINSSRVFKEAHPGAIYLHKGTQYYVQELDIASKIVKVREVNVEYYTQSRTMEDIEVLDVIREKRLGEFPVKLGKVMVTERVIGYVKKLIFGQTIMGEEALDLPPNVFETIAVWIEIPNKVKNFLWEEKRDFPGGIHALEHATIAMFPLYALCDRWDVGGVSFPYHPQLGRPAVFIYDGYLGGVGLAERAYQVFSELLKTTYRLIKDCRCELGCPSCIQSPKCGNANKPLDKGMALELLQLFLKKGDVKPEVEEENPIRRVKPEKVLKKKEEPKIIFLDLETKKSAKEVGGWEHKDLMGISIAVTYNKRKGEFKYYTEEKLKELVQELASADLVIGYNIKDFDWEVLKPYSPIDLTKLPVLDLLEAISQSLGFRVGLDNVARATLKRGKLASGLEAVEMYKQGALEKLCEYCRHDVQILRDLFEFGVQNGFILFKDEERLFRLPVKWGKENVQARANF